jgi:hypothetical protein
MLRTLEEKIAAYESMVFKDGCDARMPWNSIKYDIMPRLTGSDAKTVELRTRCLAIKAERDDIIDTIQRTVKFIIGHANESISVVGMDIDDVAAFQKEHPNATPLEEFADHEVWGL